MKKGIKINEFTARLRVITLCDRARVANCKLDEITAYNLKLVKFCRLSRFQLYFIHACDKEILHF